MNFFASHWGSIDGEDVTIYSISTEGGLEVSISNLGAAMVAMRLLNDENESLNLA